MMRFPTVKILLMAMLFTLLYSVAPPDLYAAPVITDLTLKSATTAANAQLQALRNQNGDITAFLQALKNEPAYARAIFARIRADDAAGAQALIKQKVTRCEVKGVEVKSDFHLNFLTCNATSCTSTCISSERSCGGKRFSRVTIDHAYL